ncbi:hypothetical protein [Thiolapillus sp.]|uniref:hypothetical protein n=3 Tax=Thiolapillus sp. TaxID=2017437 RepID=UPI003AF899E9
MKNLSIALLYFALAGCESLPFTPPPPPPQCDPAEPLRMINDKSLYPAVSVSSEDNKMNIQLNIENNGLKVIDQ